MYQRRSDTTSKIYVSTIFVYGNNLKKKGTVVNNIRGPSFYYPNDTVFYYRSFGMNNSSGVIYVGRNTCNRSLNPQHLYARRCINRWKKVVQNLEGNEAFRVPRGSSCENISRTVRINPLGRQKACTEVYKLYHVIPGREPFHPSIISRSTRFHACFVTRSRVSQVAARTS